MLESPSAFCVRIDFNANDRAQLHDFDISKEKSTGGVRTILIVFVILRSKILFTTIFFTSHHDRKIRKIFENLSPKQLRNLSNERETFYFFQKLQKLSLKYKNENEIRKINLLTFP